MTTLDIRVNQQEPISEIVFAEKQPLWMTMTTIRPMRGNGIAFKTPADANNAYCLHDRKDVDNLIAALEKAKELGWV